MGELSSYYQPAIPAGQAETIHPPNRSSYGGILLFSPETAAMLRTFSILTVFSLVGLSLSIAGCGGEGKRAVKKSESVPKSETTTVEAIDSGRYAKTEAKMEM